MGMSASQSRLLFISARLHDLELKSQSIANQKIRLASETEQLASNYCKALNKTKLMVTNASGSETSRLTYSSIMSKDGVLKNYSLRNGNNKVIVSNEVGTAFKNSKNVDDFLKKLRNEGVDTTDEVESVSGGGGAGGSGGASGAGGAGGYYSNLYEQMKKYGYEPCDSNKLNSADYLENMLQSGEWFLAKPDAQGEYIKQSLSSISRVSDVTDKTDIARAEAEYNAASLKLNNKEKILDNELKKLDTEHNALQTEHDSVKDIISKNVEKTFNMFS